MLDQPKCLIVGGGIAGPMLGLFLCKAGMNVSIFEASDGNNDVGAGLGLAENGLAVLQAAGLLDAIKAKSVRVAEWAFENHMGATLACIPEQSTELAQLSTVMITRAALRRVVADAATEAGVDLQYGRRLISVEDVAGEPVTLHFEDGTTAQGDLLVGADGIRSQVRQCVMPDEPKPIYSGMLAPGGYSSCIEQGAVAPQSPQRFHMRFGRNAFFGYVNILTEDGPSTLWWSTAAAPLPSRADSVERTLQNKQEDLLLLHKGWGEPVSKLIKSTENILDIAIHDVPSLSRWSVGRTVLIGDAAHAVAPHSGQGVSMALEDAMYLAKLLRGRKSEDLQHCFVAFEADRRSRTDRVIALGRKNAQRKEAMSAAAYWFQQQAMRLVLPIAGKKREGWLLDYRIEW